MDNGITAILLAAGLSKRMGKQNKLLLDINKSPMLLTAVSELQKSNIEALIVVTGFESEQIRSLMPEDITTVYNERFEQGQTSSIQSGLVALDNQNKDFMICLADMPDLTANHINELISFFKSIKEPKPISRPVKNKIPGHPVIFNREYKNQLLQCTDEDGCKSIIQSNINNLHTFSTTDNAYFADIDTPEDLNRLVE